MVERSRPVRPSDWRTLARRVPMLSAALYPLPFYPLATMTGYICPARAPADPRPACRRGRRLRARPSDARAIPPRSFSAKARRPEQIEQLRDRLELKTEQLSVRFWRTGSSAYWAGLDFPSILRGIQVAKVACSGGRSRRSGCFYAWGRPVAMRHAAGESCSALQSATRPPDRPGVCAGVAGPAITTFFVEVVLDLDLP